MLQYSQKHEGDVSSAVDVNDITEERDVVCPEKEPNTVY